MTHLEELRLMELGLGAASASADEAVHLAQCPVCADALAAERLLSQALEALPQPEVPAGFVMRTRTRFLEAQAQRRQWQLAWGMLAAALAAPLAILPLVLGVVGDLPSLARTVAVALGELATLGRVGIVLLRTMPVVAVMLTAATGTAALIWTAMLAQLARQRLGSRP